MFHVKPFKLFQLIASIIYRLSLLLVLVAFPTLLGLKTVSTVSAEPMATNVPYPPPGHPTTRPTLTPTITLTPTPTPVPLPTFTPTPGVNILHPTEPTNIELESFTAYSFGLDELTLVEVILLVVLAWIFGLVCLIVSDYIIMKLKIRKEKKNDEPNKSTSGENGATTLPDSKDRSG